MALAEGKRRRLIDAFGKMFPDFASQASAYGEFKGDSNTLKVLFKDKDTLGTLAFYDGGNGIWKLQTLKSYMEDKKK